MDLGLATEAWGTHQWTEDWIRSLFLSHGLSHANISAVMLVRDPLNVVPSMANYWCCCAFMTGMTALCLEEGIVKHFCLSSNPSILSGWSMSPWRSNKIHFVNVCLLTGVFNLFKFGVTTHSLKSMFVVFVFLCILCLDALKCLSLCHIPVSRASLQFLVIHLPVFEVIFLVIVLRVLLTLNYSNFVRINVNLILTVHWTLLLFLNNAGLF